MLSLSFYLPSFFLSLLPTSQLGQNCLQAGWNILPYHIFSPDIDLQSWPHFFVLLDSYSLKRADWALRFLIFSLSFHLSPTPHKTALYSNNYPQSLILATGLSLPLLIIGLAYPRDPFFPLLPGHCDILVFLLPSHSHSRSRAGCFVCFSSLTGFQEDRTSAYLHNVVCSLPCTGHADVKCILDICWMYLFTWGTTVIIWSSLISLLSMKVKELRGILEVIILSWLITMIGPEIYKRGMESNQRIQVTSGLLLGSQVNSVAARSEYPWWDNFHNVELLSITTDDLTILLLISSATEYAQHARLIFPLHQFNSASIYQAHSMPGALLFLGTNGW